MGRRGLGVPIIHGIALPGIGLPGRGGIGSRVLAEDEHALRGGHATLYLPAEPRPPGWIEPETWRKIRAVNVKAIAVIGSGLMSRGIAYEYDKR